MNKDEEYAPDFDPYDWSEEDIYLLKPFVTNPKGLVSAISNNLPPEIVGALCSRASRAEGSLSEVLLNEYIKPILEGDDEELKGELHAVVKFLNERGFEKILNNQRAQSFYAKWLSQYGDDSIAQLTGSHVLLWGPSQVALKFIEDRRVGLEPIEKSTRYVSYAEKVNGRYLYYIPKPDLERLGLLDEYKAVMDGLFDTYAELVPELYEWLKKNYKDKSSILEKKAFDTLRGLLPMATVSQVALRGNAQAFEYLLSRMMSHELGEFRWLAGEMKRELDKEIPSLLSRLEEDKSSVYQEYFNKREENVMQFAERMERVGSEAEPAGEPFVKLVEFDETGENKILAGILFPHIRGSWDDALGKVNVMSNEEKESLLEAYLPERKERWYKAGRAFENSYLRFEIMMDIGAYRDLHRHRMMTQERQPFSTRHGYSVPKEIAQAGLEEKYREALDSAVPLYEKLAEDSPLLAQYAVPLAYRVRFYQFQNVRQFIWETELRTISQGHPNYRRVEQEKFRLFSEHFPLVAKHIQVDMNDYEIARRGTEEKIKSKEKKILERLAKKKL